MSEIDDLLTEKLRKLPLDRSRGCEPWQSHRRGMLGDHVSNFLFKLSKGP